MEYDSAPEAVEIWGILERRIPSFAHIRRMWLVPKDAEKLVEGGHARRKTKDGKDQ